MPPTPARRAGQWYIMARRTISRVTYGGKPALTVQWDCTAGVGHICGDVQCTLPEWPISRGRFLLLVIVPLHRGGGYGACRYNTQRASTGGSGGRPLLSILPADSTPGRLVLQVAVHNVLNKR